MCYCGLSEAREGPFSFSAGHSAHPAITSICPSDGLCVFLGLHLGPCAVDHDAADDAPGYRNLVLHLFLSFDQMLEQIVSQLMNKLINSKFFQKDKDRNSKHKPPHAHAHLYADLCPQSCRASLCSAVHPDRPSHLGGAAAAAADGDPYRGPRGCGVAASRAAAAAAAAVAAAGDALCHRRRCGVAVEAPSFVRRASGGASSSCCACSESRGE